MQMSFPRFSLCKRALAPLVFPQLLTLRLSDENRQNESGELRDFLKETLEERDNSRTKAAVVLHTWVVKLAKTQNNRRRKQNNTCWAGPKGAGGPRGRGSRNSKT